MSGSRVIEKLSNVLIGYASCKEFMGKVYRYALARGSPAENDVRTASYMSVGIGSVFIYSMNPKKHRH